MSYTDAQLYALHLELKGADTKIRHARIQAFAAQHGRDESTVRKRLDKLKRMTPAADARARDVNPLLDAAVRAIWALKLTPDGPLSTEQAQVLALTEGRVSRAWPVSSLNQAAVRLGLNAHAGYARRMEADHANFAHRLDFSGSRHFRIRERMDDGDWLLAVCREEQRNKRWTEGDLLWLMVFLDDYSRLTHIEYAVAPGESAELAQDFLVRTWRSALAVGADGTGQPLGLPELLICDQGSFGKSRTTAALLDWLGVRLDLGMPLNSRRNGRVERPIRSIKEGFERTYLATHGEGTTCRLSSLREELRRYVTATNGRRHPLRPDRTKAEDWRRSIGFRTIRECPEDALRLATFRAERTVTGEGWVQHERRLLEPVGLPHGLHGRTVTLVYNRAGEMVALHDGIAYPVREARRVRLGQYESAALAGRRESPGQALLKEQARAPRSGIALFSPERQDVLATASVPRIPAPGTPVAPALPQPLAAPVARIEPARRDSPFDRASKYRSLEEAFAAVEEVLGLPLHRVPSLRGRKDDVLRNLAEMRLDRTRIHEWACRIKQAAQF